MKPIFKISSVRIPFVSLLTLLLLLGSSTATVFAQDTNAVTSLAAASPDVSQYPTNDALLPGKGPAVTWKDFPKHWAKRHMDWVKTIDKDKGAVVFLGDSITEGWNALAKAFPNIHVANRGIGGDTTRGVLYRMKADVINLNPKAVVLLIGTNDIGYNANPDDVAENIRAILLALKNSNPNMPIIVCKVMPRSDRNLHVEGKIQKLNSLLEDYVKGQPNMAVCDTWSIYADANGDCSKAIFPDLLHPNAAGYDKWAAQLKPIFAKLNLGT